MAFKKNFLIKDFITAALIISLAFGSSLLYSSGPDQHNRLESARLLYLKAAYMDAVEILNRVLETTKDDDYITRGKVFFLLGACHEKAGQTKKAFEYFSRLKELYDHDLLLSFFNVPGISTEELKEYQRVFTRPEETQTDYAALAEQEKQIIARERARIKKQDKNALKYYVGGALLLIAGAIFLAKKIHTPGDKSDAVFEDVEWVSIPAGSFVMGDNTAEGDSDEKPVHQVYLDHYYISKYEVTHEQYGRFCAETGNRFPHLLLNPNTSSFRRGGKKPITLVSWDEAREFCAWMSQKTGQKIDLPTEAQWEKAARGTDQRTYPWGNSEPDTSLAIYNDYREGPYIYKYYKDVGCCSQGQSPYGVFNMAGNVSEMCRDYYSETYFSYSPQRNPRGPESGIYRVLKGGSHAFHPYAMDKNPAKAVSLRSSDREKISQQFCSIHMGFRVVREP